jgi:hypothetical protein
MNTNTINTTDVAAAWDVDVALHSFNLKNLTSALDNINDAIDDLEADEPKVAGALGELRAAKKSIKRAIESYPSGPYPRRRVIINPPPPPPPSPGMSEEEVNFEELEAPVLDIEIPTAEVNFEHWEGPITYELEKTGDGRLFAADAVQWNEELLPFPFKWQRTSAEGHSQSVTIGRVDRIFRSEEDEGAIWGEGVILTGANAPPEAAEYINLLENGAAGGVSIDGDDAEFEILIGEDDETFLMKFSRINIRALTAVDVPAFAGARIRLKDESSVIAAVIGSTDLPVASRDRNWDGPAAQKGIFANAKTEDGFDTTKLRRAFLWLDSDGDPNLKGSYKLPFTEIIDGTLTIVPRGVFAAAAALEGARGGVNIPDTDKAGIRRKLGTLYRKINSSLPAGDEPVSPPWETASKVVALQHNQRLSFDEIQAIYASAVPVDPPSDWFDDPKLAELSPITITDEGQIAGHLAGWNTCHIGYGNCRTAPQGCDYDQFFHLGSLKTAEGTVVYVGHMTFGGGHAPLDLSSQSAAAFYDNTSTVSADIRVGEDEFGVWVAGALRPGLSEEDTRVVRSAPLSGDWRPIAGKLQLIAAHGVNVPGFPIPKAKVLVAAGGETQSLIITEDCDCYEDGDGDIILNEDFSALLFQIDLEEE